MDAKVLSILPGRVRLALPHLKGNPTFKKAILDRFHLFGDKITVKCNVKNGRMLICFDEMNYQWDNFKHLFNIDPKQKKVVGTKHTVLPKKNKSTSILKEIVPHLLFDIGVHNIQKAVKFHKILPGALKIVGF